MAATAKVLGIAQVFLIAGTSGFSFTANPIAPGIYSKNCVQESFCDSRGLLSAVCSSLRRKDDRMLHLVEEGRHNTARRCLTIWDAYMGQRGGVWMLQGCRTGGALTLREASDGGRSERDRNVQHVIALTRELGNNHRLGALLEGRGMQTVELPCIAFEEGEDVHKLPGALVEGDWEYVVITSPEAAGVFLKGWEVAGWPDVTLASVGKATEDALIQGGVTPVFTPSKATGKMLAAELPGPKKSGKVLYPASSKARTEVQGGLAEKGFTVTRLNTYDTVSAFWTEQDTARAQAAEVVTFASPSAVKTWAQRVGTHQCAACIGETSGRACEEAGFDRVFWPESPGMDGWVNSIEDAIKSINSGG